MARATLRGLSDHRFGSTELGRSGFIPDAQGATVVVPNLEHQALVMVRYAHGALRETGRCPLPAPVVGAVRWAANTGLTATFSARGVSVDRATSDGGAGNETPTPRPTTAMHWPCVLQKVSR